jgi:hypothetical protein
VVWKVEENGKENDVDGQKQRNSGFPRTGLWGQERQRDLMVWFLMEE